MKNAAKVNKTYVNKDELDQLVSMFNWSADNDESNAISLKAFKQYDSVTKEYNIVFEVWCQEWDGDKHRSVAGNGRTLSEAMGNFSKNYQIMIDVKSKFDK